MTLGRMLLCGSVSALKLRGAISQVGSSFLERNRLLRCKRKNCKFKESRVVVGICMEKEVRTVEKSFMEGHHILLQKVFCLRSIGSYKGIGVSLSMQMSHIYSSHSKENEPIFLKKASKLSSENIKCSVCLYIR